MNSVEVVLKGGQEIPEGGNFRARCCSVVVEERPHG